MYNFSSLSVIVKTDLYIFGEFGDKDLQVLLDHFNDPVLNNAAIDVAEAEVEWTMMKKEICDL
jgi:hypothetical protein